MHIGLLPAVLRDIHDDGRSNEAIIAALEAKNVAVFQKALFANRAEQIPLAGTVYNFLATLCSELPSEVRGSADRVFSAITQKRGNLRKPPLRAALLLMERMTENRLFADIVVLNEPVLNRDSGHRVLISLGREHEEGQSWVAAVAADGSLDHDSELVLFLGLNS